MELNLDMQEIQYSERLPYFHQCLFGLREELKKHFDPNDSVPLTREDIKGLPWDLVWLVFKLGG